DAGAFTPLDDGEHERWREKTWAGAGLGGPWWDWATFGRLNKGSVAIINPSAGPDDFVQEVPPPITWRAGRLCGKAAWQVLDQHKSHDGAWITIQNSRKAPGADDSYTLPWGVLRWANWTSDPGGGNWTVKTEYRVVVRTWDGQGRQTTPGDPAFYQAVREFSV